MKNDKVEGEAFDEIKNKNKNYQIMEKNKTIKPQIDVQGNRIDMEVLIKKISFNIKKKQRVKKQKQEKSCVQFNLWAKKQKTTICNERSFSVFSYI